MNLSEISENNKQEELVIQKSINDAIDENQDIIFNAGAGAGKTYALVESLKHIISMHGRRLSAHNQKIMCITYTNVAANEINERLVSSELVKVSTIHEILWQIIKKHQKQLITIHKETLETELTNLSFDLSENDNEKVSKTFAAYRHLSDEQRDSLSAYILEHKDVFYQNYNKSAADIRAVFDIDLNIYPNLLKNVGSFKKILNVIIKMNNYKECLSFIKEGKSGFTSIKYDSQFNTDILHRMLISHDTLLEYSVKLVGRYELLKQIIIDSYPYILIDEYQDTNEKVVKIMHLLSEYSSKSEREVFIGYFGDTVQNIYDDGVGNYIRDVHSNLLPIDKLFNRRSYSEIITIINRIRADHIQQVSVYNQSTGGSVKLYAGSGDEQLNLINAFTQKYKEEWDVNNQNKLHCLVLTNKLVAELSGFSELYAVFSNTDFYKRYYDRLNSELLSTDVSKLGEVQSTLYKIMHFKNMLGNSKTSLNSIFRRDKFANLSLLELRETMSRLSCFSAVTFKGVMESIFIEYEKSKQNSVFRELIHGLIQLENYTFESFISYLKLHLFDGDETSAEHDNELIQSLLDVDLSQYLRWVVFVEDKQDSEVVYHTYHGTKGLEFENVIIIMENDFGARNKNKFSDFFKKTLNRGAIVGEIENAKFENTKNLLYVSCSRAIKNLRVLYLDDVTEFKQGIESIFGEVEFFSL